MNAINYWSRLLRLFYHYKRKATVLPYLPVRLWVELTSDCNYSCVMCPNKDLRKEDRGLMPLELFKKIVDEAADWVFEINLAHRGESLLHSQIPEIVALAREKKIFTRLHTNGSLLTEDLSRRLIEEGLDRLSISFDGFDKATYEKIRRGGDFDKTAANIVRFLQIKRELGSKTPETAIEVIKFPPVEAGTESAESFRKRFEGLPLDSFVMKDLHNWAGEIRTDKPGKHYSVCTFPWNALVILWDGAVLPCTQDFFGTYVVGNANQSSLEELWNGEGMRELRRRLAAGDIKDLKACSRCDRAWRKGFLGVPREFLWKFITKRMP
jgi:radical SAM protein with 4Fe4S-binding SPASM domain